MTKKYKIINYEKICNEVLKEVIFSLEKKLLLEQEETGQTNNAIVQRSRPKKQPYKMTDVSELKDIVKELLTPRMKEFKITRFDDGRVKRDLIIVYATPAERLENSKKVFEFISNVRDEKGEPLFENVADFFGYSSIPYTQLNFSESFEKDGKTHYVNKPIMLVHKFEYKTTWGLAQENILAYVLDQQQDPKQMSKLKKRLGEPINKTGLEINELLSTPEWQPMLKMAENAKKVIDDTFGVGNVASAKVVGGTGGKEDIELTLSSPWEDPLSTTTPKKTHSTIHISSKLALTGKNPFIANIDLGDGVKTTSTLSLTEAADFGASEEGQEISISNNLIKNPDNVPWWVTVRIKLAQKYLEKEEIKNSPKDKETISNYITNLKTNYRDLYDTPGWLFRFRDKYPSDYKIILGEFHEQIRNIFNESLKKLKPKQLAKFVEYAFFGTRTEESPPLFKITMSSSGATLERVIQGKVVGDNPNNTITVKGAQTTIEVPGMNQMIISGLKFRNSVMSSKPGDLNIKTRA